MPLFQAKGQTPRGFSASVSDTNVDNTQSFLAKCDYQDRTMTTHAHRIGQLNLARHDLGDKHTDVLSLCVSVYDVSGTLHISLLSLSQLVGHQSQGTLRHTVRRYADEIGDHTFYAIRDDVRSGAPARLISLEGAFILLQHVRGERARLLAQWFVDSGPLVSFDTSTPAGGLSCESGVSPVPTKGGVCLPSPKKARPAQGHESTVYSVPARTRLRGQAYVVRMRRQRSLCYRCSVRLGGLARDVDVLNCRMSEHLAKIRSVKRQE